MSDSADAASDVDEQENPKPESEAADSDAGDESNVKAASDAGDSDVSEPKSPQPVAEVADSDSGEPESLQPIAEAADSDAGDESNVKAASNADGSDAGDGDRPKAVIDSDEDDAENPKPAAESDAEDEDNAKPVSRIIDSDASDEEKAADSDAEENKARAANSDGDEPRLPWNLDEDTGERDSAEPDDQPGGSSHKRKQAFVSDDEDNNVRMKPAPPAYDSDEDQPRHRWDFDEMMAKKKAERKQSRKRKRRGDVIDLISDSDDQLKALVDTMQRAAALDRTSNENNQPAFQKQKMLLIVKQTLLKTDLFEAMLDNGMMSAVSDWLAPLPDKSLPSLEIRTTLLKILESYPTLEQGVLRQSGLGKAVMYLLKHQRETRENKDRCAKLIRDWSRPIFQLENDFTAMAREQRMQSEASRGKRTRIDDDPDAPSSSRRNIDQFADGDHIVPGQAGFVSRARVPRPSMKAYVHRPSSKVEGEFRGESKARGATRLDVAQRDFRERTRTQKAKRAVTVSIAGNKMEI